MTTDDNTLAQLVEVFRGEAPELIESINRALIQAETVGNIEERGQGLIVAARSAHNLKGIAGMMGFAGPQGLAHGAEDVLDRLREGAVEATPDVVDALLSALDRLGAGPPEKGV